MKRFLLILAVGLAACSASRTLNIVPRWIAAHLLGVQIGGQWAWFVFIAAAVALLIAVVLRTSEEELNQNRALICLFLLTFFALGGWRMWQVPGASITSNGTGGGNWHTPASWSGGVVPGNGDQGVIANGDKITCEISQTCTIGTSPAADQTVAPFDLECAAGSASSTGQLQVDGTLVYRGTVRLCKGNFTLNGTAQMDASLAATPSSAHYSFKTGGAGGTWTINPGAVWTANQGGACAGACFAGAIGGLNITGTYANFIADQASFSYIGGASVMALADALNTSGATFSVTNSTFDHTAGFQVGGPIHAAAVLKINGNTFTNPVGLNSNRWFDLENMAALTTGTREVKNNYWEGGLLYTSSGAGGNAVDITISGNYCWNGGNNAVGCFGTNANDSAYPLESVAGLYQNNIAELQTTGAAGVGLMQGYVSRMYIYSYGGSNCATQNYHPASVYSNHDSDYSYFIFEIDCNSGFGSHAFITGRGTVATNLTIHHNLTISGDAGYGSLVTWVSGAGTAPTVTAYNNTHLAHGDGTGTTRGGIATDTSTGYVGMYVSTRDNIFYNKASGAGIGAGYTTTAGTYVAGSIDYNLLSLITGTPWNGDAASATGANNATHDAQFVDNTRNLLKFCQSLDAAVVTMADCRAHFKARDAGYTPSAAIDWVRAGFAPQYAGAATMSSTGSYVGAVAPAAASSTPPPQMMTTGVGQ